MASSARPPAYPDATDETIRVMVVDDSIVARTMLGRIVNARPGFEVVAEAASARAALDKLADVPVDMIVLDVEMPGQNGLAALPELIAASGGARVLVVSSACAEGAETCVAALRLGAADTLLKPGAGDLAGRFAEELVHRLRRIARASAVAPPTGLPFALTLPEITRDRPAGCLGIGASTGGVHALAPFLGALPASFRAPILVTQHLPAPFMPYFARQLAEMAGRPARIAVDGMRLVAGELLLAPGDAHLAILRTRDVVHAKLERHAVPSGCRPSVDPMFASIGRVFGATGVGVMLSGMGRDGVNGARALHDAGGMIVAQDAASSVVWGMPGAVVAAGLAQAVAPPEELARLIGDGASRLAESSPWR